LSFGEAASPAMGGFFRALIVAFKTDSVSWFGIDITEDDTTV
jgi:hypothetical protein